MAAKVPFQDLGHEPVDSAAARGDRLQNRRAVLLSVQCPLDGFDLAANASHAIEEFLFVPSCVRQRFPSLYT
jgi:hypothetical protein